MNEINLIYGDFTSKQLPGGHIQIVSKEADALEPAQWQHFTVKVRLHNEPYYQLKPMDKVIIGDWDSDKPEDQPRLNLIANFINVGKIHVQSYETPANAGELEKEQLQRWQKQQLVNFELASKIFDARSTKQAKDFIDSVR